MLYVTWKIALLTADKFSGHRVKRRMLAGDLPEVIPGGVYSGATWQANAPATYSFVPAGGAPSTYKFGFWSVRFITEKPLAQVPVVPSRTFSLTSDPASMAVVEATAWYFWDFGTGPGDHGIYIDAFDLDQQDWLANDFVTVAPDPGQLLTPLANDGLLTTTEEHIPGPSVTISALDSLKDLFVRHRFVQWLEVPALTHAGDPTVGPPIVGVPPQDRDLIAHRGDIAVAIALYSSTQEIEWHRYEVMDPWWRRWVLRPPPIEDPRTSMSPSVLAALALVDAASKVAPRLRAGVIELAVEQLSLGLNAGESVSGDLKSKRSPNRRK